MKYDSILKEKKVYKDPEVTHSKFTKYVLLYLFCIFIIVMISYVCYYHTILAPSNIFVSDLYQVIRKYQEPFSYLYPFSRDHSTTFHGSILLNDLLYNYKMVLDDQKFMIQLSSQEESFLYTLKDREQYLSLSSFSDKKIHLENSVSLHMLEEMKENITTSLKNQQYIKNFYFQDHVPVVEVNLVLTSNDLSQLIPNISIEDDYEVIFTFKNHALTNEIVGMKAIINNKTNGNRNVLEYDGKRIQYTSVQEEKYQFVLERKKDDFELKIYHGDELYSVLSGIKKDSSYQYIYQVIDQIYNISLTILKEENNYEYQFLSNIEKEESEVKQSANLKIFYPDNELLEESDKPLIEYQSFTKEEKENYQQKINGFFEPLRKFVDQYKEDINKLDS